MCGIIGYIGSRQAGPILLEGLKKLEYRGYDSSGIAVIDDGVISVIKSVGMIKALDEKSKGGSVVSGTVGIGHTRWATHGAPSDENSHPHLSSDKRFAIVHNGIIENFESLRTELKSLGYKFTGETDSEVIAKLIQHHYCGDIISTLRTVITRLEGSYAVGIISADKPDALYAIRKDNPLVVGLGDGENFIASDYTAALEHTKNFVLLGDKEIAEITATETKFYDVDGKQIKKKPYTVEWNIEEAQKGGYAHFMLKEIFEQPRALTRTVRPRIAGDEIKLDGIEFDGDYLSSLERIDIIGCGSAYHAGIVGKSFIEKHCRIPVNNILASEYIYSDPITGPKTLTVIISQSGETADTLSALKIAASRGSRTLAVVNVVQSAIARAADDVLYTHAGPEIAVATTKGYTTQIAALYLIGLKIALKKGSITVKRYKELLSGLVTLPQTVEDMLSEAEVKKVRKYAEKFHNQKCVFFIGRGTDYAASLEGALKLKEISYIHAEAYAAGELKHGTISLIEDHTLTLALVTQEKLYHKMESNIKAVKSRGGTVIALASRANSKIKSCTDMLLTIPDCDDDISPVLTAVQLQLFAYYIALKRGCEIDTPRNLAKSVTVE
ncbi:MAG: glutamine--fructose-6-phosphate transaminase (isomerizing) [Clostridiales bacterium]|nr:glutamine--fructose-6-phosphate transaminase (isomerizing) [Clostridiales bacterium]